MDGHTFVQYRLEVQSSGFKYLITNELGEILNKPTRYVVICDEKVEQSARKIFSQVSDFITLEVNEKVKTLDGAGKILLELAQRGVVRGDTLIAVGGGAHVAIGVTPAATNTDYYVPVGETVTLGLTKASNRVVGITTGTSFSFILAPKIATILNEVNITLAVLSEIKDIKSLIYVPQAIPSFSTNIISNQLKISTLSCSSKFIFIYTLLI